MIACSCGVTAIIAAWGLSPAAQGLEMLDCTHRTLSDAAAFLETISAMSTPEQGSRRAEILLKSMLFRRYELGSLDLAQRLYRPDGTR
jgi:hypothetical protein